MKLIIAGSRTFTDYQLLCQVLAPERHRITRGHARRRPRCGSARLSLGTASTISRSRSSPRTGSALGKAAGVRRNHQMAQAGDVLIAFWDGQSTGTAHMVQCMRQFGKPVVVIRVEATA